VGKLIEFGGVLVAIRDETKSAECQHLNIVLDQNGQIVTCGTCQAQLNPFWALLQLVGRYDEAWKALETLRPSPLGLRVTEVPQTPSETPAPPEPPRSLA
jgi:hypothetical protein